MWRQIVTSNVIRSSQKASPRLKVWRSLRKRPSAEPYLDNRFSSFMSLVTIETHIMYIFFEAEYNLEYDSQNTKAISQIW